MQQYTNIPYLPHNIYNLYAQFKQEQLYGLAVTDALIKYLKAKGLLYAIKPDKDNWT